MFKTVIFDLDGTLLDTLDDLWAAVNAALEKFGYPPRTKEEVRAFIGNGIVKLMQRAVGDENCGNFQEILAEFKRYYGVHCADKTKEYAGVTLLLRALNARGVKTAVVSNKADFAVKALAAQYFDGLLSVAVGEDEAHGIRKKPAPDSLLSVMDGLGAARESTLYVGDSEVDIQTAENAGVACLSVTWGFKDRKFLAENGAQAYVDSPLEILDFLAKESSVYEFIGNTPLVEIKSASANAQIFAKVEGVNAGGSIKDRVAKAIVETAENAGRLCEGGTVIEATSGNTGVGLALICLKKGYRAKIVMPDSMSEERRALIRKYSGDVVLTDGKKGMQGAVEKANELLENTPNAILADQFNNPVCADVHYQTTAPEIWKQTGGKVDIFVACVGTGGTLTGIGRYLKEKNPAVKVVAVEPVKSPLLSQGWAGAHGIQGIGANFIPAVLDRTVYDEVVTVTDDEAFACAKGLFKKENLFVGISSGAAFAACEKLAALPENKGKTIVTVFADEGGRYASIGLFD